MVVKGEHYENNIQQGVTIFTYKNKIHHFEWKK